MPASTSRSVAMETCAIAGGAPLPAVGCMLGKAMNGLKIPLTSHLPKLSGHIVTATVAVTEIVLWWLTTKTILTDRSVQGTS